MNLPRRSPLRHPGIQVRRVFCRTLSDSNGDCIHSPLEANNRGTTDSIAESDSDEDLDIPDLLDARFLPELDITSVEDVALDMDMYNDSDSLAVEEMEFMEVDSDDSE